MCIYYFWKSATIKSMDWQQQKMICLLNKQKVVQMLCIEEQRKAGSYYYNGKSDPLVGHHLRI